MGNQYHIICHGALSGITMFAVEMVVEGKDSQPFQVRDVMLLIMATMGTFTRLLLIPKQENKELVIVQLLAIMLVLVPQWHQMVS